MVGVASGKRCHACTKRKIKCDEERPECGQCRKRNRPCPGYHREFIFLGSSITSEPSSSPGAPALTTNVILSERRPSDSPADDEDTSESLALSRKRQSKRERRNLWTPDLAKQVDPRHLEKLGLIQSFIDIYYPQNSTDAAFQTNSYFSWLTVVPGIIGDNDALSPSITALAMARIGRKTNNVELVQEARRTILLGLRRLQTAINDKSLCYRDETFAACLALSLFEVFENISGSIHGWLAHLKGVARLIRLRGPMLHRTGQAHKLYQGFCRLALINGLASRSSYFLAEPEWVTLPWTINEKHTENYIMDEMFKCGGLAEEHDLLEKVLDVEESMLRRYNLIHDCWNVHCELERLCKQLEAENSSATYWPSLATLTNPTDNSDEGKVFPISYQFANIRTAHIYLLYWTAQILLLHTLHTTYIKLGLQLGRSLAPADFPSCPYSSTNCTWCFTFDPIPASPAIIETIHKEIDLDQLPPCPNFDAYWQCARNIAQSVEYCLSDTMGLVGPSIVMFPLRFALNAFSHIPGRELAWTQATFARLNIIKGIPLSQYVETTMFKAQSKAHSQPIPKGF